MSRLIPVVTTLALLWGFTLSPLSAQEAPPQKGQEETQDATTPANQTTAPTATTDETAPEDTLPESGYRLVQPDDILFTFIEFRNYDHLRQLQEQMLSIPGLTNFIPHLEAPGLLTYRLRYSGATEHLMKALQEIFAAQYELGLKEMGEKSWEITMRRSSRPAE